MQYEVIQGKNDSYRLRCAVPGFTKDQINCSLENGWIIVRAERDRSSNSLVEGGLPVKLQEKFKIGPTFKVDMASLQDGILEVLFSKNLEVDGTRITIL